MGKNQQKKEFEELHEFKEKSGIATKRHKKAQEAQKKNREWARLR
jgi:hypothetical protein